MQIKARESNFKVMLYRILKAPVHKTHGIFSKNHLELLITAQFCDPQLVYRIDHII